MSFETADMAATLPEVTNGTTTQPNGPPKDQEAFDKARSKGWVAPSAYDYSATSKISKSADDLAAIPQDEQPQWAHLAAKYEWKDEYGDVGPEIPELEKQLFGNEYITRQGENFNE
jgi:ATP-dependent RNA helicase DDX3X